MNRDDVEKILNNEDTLDYGSQSGYECGMINNLIDKIYDDFEKDLKEFQFTSCDDCKNKIDGTYQEVCSNCKRFYGCYFVAKEV